MLNRVTMPSGAALLGRFSGAAGVSQAFPKPRDARRYLILVLVLAVLSIAVTAGILLWDNPIPFGERGFWRIVELRITSIVVIAVVVTCQALATVAFQTVATNRIVTPSIMGFEALYVALSTSAVFFLGSAGLSALQGVPQFLLQTTLMIGLAVLLYGTLLSGKYANIHVMLLVGIVIGGGLGSLSTFMQRLLAPSEFDILTARLFGSVGNAESSYLPIAVPACILSALALWLRSHRLNTLALGRTASTNLGLPYRREVIITLTLVAILMALSTALIGPMTFLGFLVATLAYQAANTYDHRFIFPVAALIGFVILGGAYFVLNNVFYAEGAVSIIIEAVGGTVFLYVILRKGRL